MVQKKINWGNKEAVVVITDKQEKRDPPIPPAEKINSLTKARRRKEKAAKRPKRTSPCQKNSKKVAKRDRMI